MNESAIEANLYRVLYQRYAKILRRQHKIDYYSDLRLMIPDFAFPDAKNAIFCDGYQWHKDYEPFCKDRYQSRELQLKGWLVLRFTGREINDDIDGVLHTIDRAIADRDAYFYCRSGISDTEEGDYDQALANLNRAIELDSNYAYAYHKRGSVYFKKGDYNRSIADFSTAITLNPDFAPTYWERGMAYAQIGDHTRKEADYARAKELQKNKSSKN